MNALQRIELLEEHASLVQAIPTQKGMAKLESLERLSEIVVLLGGQAEQKPTSVEQDSEPQEIDVTAIDTDFSKYGADNKTAVMNFLKPLQGKYINTQIGKVLFNAISTKELSFKTRDDELRAKIVLYVPNTLQNGEYLGRDELYKERKDSFVAFHTFKGVAQIDDNNVEHTVKVGERANGEFVFVAYHSRYDMLDNLGNKKEPPFQHIGGSQKPVLDTISNHKVGRSQTGFSNILLDQADDVNEYDDEFEIDNSTASLFDELMLDELMLDDIEDDTDGWNIQIISITPIQKDENKAQALVDEYIAQDNPEGQLAKQQAEQEKARLAEIEQERQATEQRAKWERQQEILAEKAKLIENEVMPAFKDVELYEHSVSSAVKQLAEQSYYAKELGFETNKEFIEHLAKQGAEFDSRKEYSDDYVPMEYRSKFERRERNYGTITTRYFAKLADGTTYGIDEAEYHYGDYIRARLKEKQVMQNPNYTQDDIDYLNSIVNGTTDPLEVDFDRLIAIGEKDDTDPLFEQANDVISEALDKATQGE